MWIDTFVFNGAFGICAFQFNFFFFLYDFILFVFPSALLHSALSLLEPLRLSLLLLLLFLFFFRYSSSGSGWIRIQMYDCICVCIIRYLYLCSRYSNFSVSIRERDRTFNAHIMYIYTWACVFSFFARFVIFLLFYFSFAFNSLSACFSLVSFLLYFLFCTCSWKAAAAAALLLPRCVAAAAVAAASSSLIRIELWICIFGVWIVSVWRVIRIHIHTHTVRCVFYI